jgi:hypothetical protein
LKVLFGCLSSGLFFVACRSSPFNETTNELPRRGHRRTRFLKYFTSLFPAEPKKSAVGAADNSPGQSESASDAEQPVEKLWTPPLRGILDLG